MAFTEKQTRIMKKAAGHTNTDNYVLGDWRLTKSKARASAFRSFITATAGLIGTGILYCEPVIKGADIAVKKGIFTKELISNTNAFMRNPNLNSLIVPLGIGIATIVSVKGIANSCKNMKDGMKLVKESKKAVKELKKAPTKKPVATTAAPLVAAPAPKAK